MHPPMEQGVTTMADLSEVRELTTCLAVQHRDMLIDFVWAIFLLGIYLKSCSTSTF